MSKYNFTEYIENHTLRCEASYRGGGIEIDASDYLGIEGARMTAYQNYLGGGMLGSIQSDHNMKNETLKPQTVRRIELLSDALKRYFHNLTNHDDEWENETFEHNQLKPESAY